MHFSYFKSLALPWQAHIICECGTRLTERKIGNTLIELYQIDAFYAEVHYRLSDNEIMKISTFQDVQFLEPYLQSISLENVTLGIVRNNNFEK
jgi:hypothetical protein